MAIMGSADLAEIAAGLFSELKDAREDYRLKSFATGLFPELTAARQTCEILKCLKDTTGHVREGQDMYPGKFVALYVARTPGIAMCAVYYTLRSAEAQDSPK